MARSSYTCCNHRFVLKSAEHPYYCGRCYQLGYGLSYSCCKSGCNVFHHKQCENPQKLMKYPFSTFSTECVLKFRTSGSNYFLSDVCDVCAKNIKGYHYECSCPSIKHHVHPFCLSYEPTLVAADGLTLHLKRAATAKCLHCGLKNLRLRVRGWAYVSSCGEYCYHVSCVNSIITSNWNNAFFTGESDPFLCIKKKFPADVDRMHQIAMKKKKQKTRKIVTTVLSTIFNVFTGNLAGLVGNAQSYFS